MFVNEFDKFVLSVIIEADNQTQSNASENAPEAPPQENEGDAPSTDEMPPEDNFEPAEIVSPEEIELAKLAVRAIYFNVNSKDLHRLKLKVGEEIIPFEKIPDYFERTKKIIPILGFVEWAMDKYEGLSSKWTEDPSFKGLGIVEKIKKYNQEMPPEQKLDNGKRGYWTRIILNCLLRGSANFNLNISDINEKNIKEVFRLLKQEFGRDTRGLFATDVDTSGPGTF